jgi:hypothetical protein
MNPAELEEKVLELERYKREEEQERAREQARKKRDMQQTRKQLQREIKKTHQEVRARTAEVEAIERTVIKVQEQEERSIERQTTLNLRFQKRATEVEARMEDKASFLQERQTELGMARGHLAHLQFALRSLDDNLIIPIGDEVEIPPTPLRGAELTAALRKEAEELRAEARRLERENGMLHEELKEVRRVFGPGPFDLVLDDSQDGTSFITKTGTVALMDTEASRAEPAPEPPASLSRATTTATATSAVEPWAKSVAPSRLRSGTGPSLSVTRSWSPVPSTSLKAAPLGLPQSAASTARLTSAGAGSRLSFGSLSATSLPSTVAPVGVAMVVGNTPATAVAAPMPTTVGSIGSRVAVGSAAVGTGSWSPASAVRSWTWSGGSLPVARGESTVSAVAA